MRYLWYDKNVNLVDVLGWKQKEKAMYLVGDQLVHPGAGACVIREVSEKEMYHPPAKMYYTLHPVQGHGTTWMIPVENAEKIGLRRVMSSQQADVLIAAFPGLPSTWIADRNQRTKHYNLIFKDNSVQGMKELMQTLKMLLVREPEGKLPFDDKEMLRKILIKVVSELAVAKEENYDSLVDALKDMLDTEEAIAI